MKYRLVNSGRPAVFLLPSLKLKGLDGNGIRIDEKIDRFLLEKFGGYTVTSGNIFGHWKDENGKDYYGEHKEYEVYFLGKHRIPHLARFLAQIAFDINEQCIYLKTGEDTWFVYPIPSK
ncbi:MAG: hypothetical protein HY226_05115 [Candidatus Vogelbacteria bacterium]|nr:hypothetical protein [Candidatus Vogelbacteria bacterium]